MFKYRKDYQKHCLLCGKAGVGNQPHVRFCSQHCGGLYECGSTLEQWQDRQNELIRRRVVRAEAMAERARIRHLRARLKAYVYRGDCPQCGGAVIGHGGMKFCSPACNSRFFSVRASLRTAARLGKPSACTGICIDCRGPVERRGPRMTLRCGVCDDRLRRAWKSRDKAVRRMRIRDNGSAETILAEHVFERDSWTCQICAEPVLRQSADVYHDLIPTLDHIVPLARGGTHTYDNVQCAHWICNSRKCDSMVA